MGNSGSPEKFSGGKSKWRFLENFGSIQMGMRGWRRRRVADRDHPPRARQIKNKASSCLFTFPLALPPLPATFSPPSEGFAITGSACFLLDDGFHITSVSARWFSISFCGLFKFSSI